MENNIRKITENEVETFISETNGDDITIMIIDVNNTSMRLANIVATHCNNPQYTGSLFTQLTIEEVDDAVFKEDSIFRQHYKRKYNRAYKHLRECYRLMEKYHFQFKCIDDSEMRKVIGETVKVTDKYWGEYINSLNDRHVIIIDDGDTHEKIINEVYESTTTYFVPKSITVFTTSNVK